MASLCEAPPGATVCGNCGNAKPMTAKHFVYCRVLERCIPKGRSDCGRGQWEVSVLTGKEETA
jgi:hypothetical protein